MAAFSISIEVFFSYSHRDEELRNELEDHLTILRRQGVITGWHDRKIAAGTVWAEQIDEHLNHAQIILLLISASFLASDYCYAKEMMRAMERHELGEARVIPVILRACDWKGAPFGKLQTLPRDAKPVNSWTDRDEAFDDVARGIRRAAEELARTSSQPARGSASDTISETPKPKSISIEFEAHRFTGTVTIGGKPAPDGTKVSAWKHTEDLGGLVLRLVPEVEVVETEVKDWRYRLEVPHNNLFAFAPKLGFSIDDLLIADQTASWQAGGDTHLDLTAKSTSTYREAHRFTGTVTIGGKPAPDGTKVSAWGRGGWLSGELRLVASTSVVHGRYRLLVVRPTGNPDIVLKIDDLLIADQGVFWATGGDTHLDLTAEAFRP